MTYQEKRTYTTKRNVMAGGLHAAARLLTALLLLAAGAGQAWSQTKASVEEGYYRIIWGNNATNYYLAPGTRSTQDFYNKDSATPYLRPTATMSDDVLWEIRDAGDGNYYLIHYIDGKYVVLNNTAAAKSEPSEAVHLEGGLTKITSNTAKFYLTKPDDYYRIFGLYNTYASFNPKGGINGITQSGANGRIGLYRSTDNGSRWKLEKVEGICKAPIVKFSETVADEITITCPEADATIYYTTDGSDPRSSDSRNSGDGTSFSISVSGVTEVKAYAEKDDMTPSATALFAPHVEDPVVVYNPVSNTFSFTCETPLVSYYYTTDGSTPTTESTLFSEPFMPAADAKTVKVIAVKGSLTSSATSYDIVFQTTVGSELRPYLIRNNGNNWSDDAKSKPFFLIPNTANNTTNTTSIPMARMEWYIENAVEEGGVVYYCFQNKDTNDYLYYNGSDIVLSNSYSSTDNGFRFSIVPNSTTEYNIIPYGLTSESRFLHKQDGNDKNTAVGLNKDANNARSQWTFVLKADIDRSVPFKTDGTLYKISNRSNSGAYNIIMPSTGSSRVTISNSTSAEDSPKIAWYFEEAGSDDWNTYYYIRSYGTDDYLYFIGTKANTYADNDNRFEAWADPSQGEAERAQYIIVKSPWNNSWWIVPKLYAETQYDQICSLRMRDKKYLLSDCNRSNQETSWNFATTTPQVVVPSITFDYNTEKVTLTDVTAGATIYYTTDGSDPDLENVGGGNPTQLYSEPFTLPAPPATVKAIATKTNWLNSEIGSSTIERVATPVFDLSAGSNVAITCTTPNAAIYYTTDGTTPTTSSALYRRPLTDDISGKIVMAIAVKPGYFISEVAAMADPVTLGCATPVITRTGEKTFTISCRFPEEGVKIYYTIDDSSTDLAANPTAGTLYTGEVTLTSLPATIRAIATAPGYNNSQQLAERTFTEGLPGTGTADDPYLIEVASDYDKFIAKVNADEAGAYYRVVGDFSASGAAEITKSFTGTFDGGYHTISGLSHAIFNTIDGGTVKNVMLSDVSISSGTDVGAIANNVTGTSGKMGAVYNCGVLSGSVSGSDNVGSLVGILGSTENGDFSYARVINCFSYAEVSGGTNVGGLVGYNWYSSTSANLRTMVMNCMFYGNITSGTNVSPIYGGEIIRSNYVSDTDAGINNYNYYRFNSTISGGTTIYNCALAAEDRFLTRFEFYRQMLNSNRELACWYATGSAANARTEMAKWVLETADRTIDAPMSYPVLKPQAYYPSIINYDSENAERFSGLEEDRNKGRILTGMGSSGTLRVNISMGSGGAQFAPPTGAAITNSSVILDITDKDYDHYNFNYGKVQLPYYNDVGTGNYTKGRVVTGWKITSVSGGKKGTFKKEDSAEGYNFADRQCTDKDLYSVTDRIFSQGAYFDVPDGVTAITIEPYWAKAVYLSDPDYDKTYNSTYGNATDFAPAGVRYSNNADYPVAGSEQKVYTSLSGAINGLGPNSAHTVFDYAVVLVGNYHAYMGGNSIKNDDNPFTIMSVDNDGDNEPDCSFIYQHTQRLQVSPIRFDFLNWIGVGMAQKAYGSVRMPNIGIFRPRGWFEVTNTCIAQFYQIEYDDGNKKSAPFILQGGVVEQIVSSKQDANADHTSYIHLGSNVWFKMFNNGIHADKVRFTKHIPISVTGGDYDQFYLSGMFRPDANVNADDAECYISGGRFGELAGSGQEQIQGNVTWKIDRADIENFYGGGINAAKPITGNVNVDIRNSYVDVYCGGPKFGDMATGKAVTTNADGCTFGTYFGAGYGGTSYNRVRTRNEVNQPNYPFNDWANDYGRNYNSGNGGISTNYEYELFAYSGFGDNNNVGRFYVNYASLSLAITKDVKSTLTGCTIENNFYGGGNLGKVEGNVTSTLTDCEVKGNAFGAGFSAAAPTVDVMPKQGYTTVPNYNGEIGAYTIGVPPASTTYTWSNKGTNANPFTEDSEGNWIHTDADLTSLGTVGGKVTLNIEGSTLVEGYAFNESGTPTDQTGGVFGGGDASAALGDTEVNISATSQKAGSSYNTYNVFGGGNVASVGGSTAVNVTNGIVQNSVYGGCNAQGTIGGNTTVTLTGGSIGTDWGKTPPATLPDRVFGGGLGEPTLVSGNVTVNVGKSDHTGTATIWGNVYGGSALGNTNATRPESALVFDATKKTDVNLYAGTIKGWAFGGGLGRKKSEGVTAVESFVGGDVFVTLDGAKVKQVFGCNNLNGTPKGHVKVHVKRTKNFSDAADADDYKNISTTPLAERTTYDVEAVYGGGNQADYVPTNATLDPSVEANKTLIDNAFAQVIIEGCDKTSIADVYGGGNAAAVPATEITINEAYIIDRVFGGGNGYGDGNPGADVGVNDRAAYATNKKTGIYGTGIAKTKLVGGQVHVVYGGSNTLGNVRGGTTMERKESSNCELKIGEIYGAGQVAPMDGDVNIVLECMPESFVKAVYGGAKNAIVNGNVSLTVTSGKYGRVFGGNNEGGSINGSITVNAYEDGCQPLIIGELYGGGYKAPYSIYGCTQDGDQWTANESGTLYFDQEKPGYERAAVQVNVYSCTSIGKVFGGGYQAPVIGNTHVWINMMKGLVDDPESPGYKKKNPIGKIGQVFGGGNEAVVKGNTTIDIGTAPSYNGDVVEDMGVNIKSGDDYLAAESDTPISLTAGIYGGGNAADVEGNTTLNIGTANQNQGVNISGNIFGGGYGQTTTVTGDVTVNIGKRTNTAAEGDPVYVYDGYAKITGDVYGGSAKGKVNATKGDTPAFSATAGKTTQVNLYGGTITGSMYGGGLGEATHAADVYGPVTVNVYGGKVDKVFGCNNVLGSPQRTATVNINGTSELAEGETYAISNVYGGGNQAAYNGTGGVSVTMAGGYVNDVFGGGLGASATVNGTTSVTLTGGNVTNDIYGGGSQGNVTGAVTVALNGGTVARDVYGGGALADTNTAYEAEGANAAHVTSVTLAGATITRNVYGGGLGQLDADAVPASGVEGEEGYVPATPAVEAVAANVTGPVKVVVTSGKVANVFGCNNINGAPQSTVDVEIGTKTGASAPYTYGGTATISGSVYGGGNMAAYAGSPAVKLYGGTVSTNVYGGGLGATAVTEDTSVTVEGGTVNNDVFGGGSQADVTGSVSVTVSGGTVKNDVYGGGALANTNTNNWDTPGSATKYVEVTGLNEATYYNTITIPVGESVEGYYTYNGSAYVAATGTAVKDVTYYQRLTGAPIAGYYTKEGDVYTLQTSGTADTETTYYKKVVVGSWATGKNSNETGTVNKTTVILTGGSVGNVYGGGLGNSTTAANVYGDVKVTVNKPEELTSTGGTGIGFSHKEERVTFGEGDKRKEYIIPLTGRVFGCNNINGTPTGNVRVEVYSTRQADENGNVISNTEHSPNSSNNRYEIQGVYGGGNLSDYLPADGKGTSVYVDGCDVTSIEKVYGGGNSASVPSSNVTINGSYDIGYAFGGGNGGDLVKKDGTWYDNDGAIVIGTAHIAPIGGKIGAVFGGSDAKGNCGSVEIDKSQTNPDCALKIIRMYGAGNEADVDNVNIIISSCSGGSEAEIEYVYGGSYNANVAHDVTLTITAGKFKNIYGGNDRTGSIGGNITVNIEETDNCMPITIQNLLGGGYQAPYPGTKRDGTEIITPGKITVNVKSATHIDNIYGGSFKADVNGDTEVNINMTKGYFAGKTYSGEAIADDVGTIGNVYGGGNQGVVRGNATVNIGTATTVGYVTEPIHLRTEPETELPKTDGLYVVSVVGARITGDVFGGGNEANVNRSTAVNIGTAVTNVSIGGSVYGGGSQADVLTNTNVTMAGGYVFDGVYGGGLRGSVGTFTRTTAITTESNGVNHASHTGCVGKPTECTAGGKCTVVVSGGQVGPVEVVLADGDIEGGMKNTAGYFKATGERNSPVDYGFVFGAGRGEVEDPATDADADFHCYVNETDVTISGTALIMASVYGGGENGRVLHDTKVTIAGGQIGCGKEQYNVDGSGNPTTGKAYTETQWETAAAAVASGNAASIDAAALAECPSWDYGKDTNSDGVKDQFLPYDPLYFEPILGEGDSDDDAGEGTDGHTYYGNVFGGGSGYYPYEKADKGEKKHDWLRSAGWVEGNTTVNITGGHILTSVYGGNETTDVGRDDDATTGKCTITMSGGTIGVPRTLAQIADHPVTCYLFGAGKGDQRTHFNTWTNVNETEVTVTGGIIYGSVFGGGEDGHVLKNAKVNIGKAATAAEGTEGEEGYKPAVPSSGPTIGTWGTSYVDGNVFGGGRGFSGEALTAGSIGGNVTVNIMGGTMLGSVYGGGRLASVGIGFTDPEDLAYGLLIDETTGGTTHGHITIDISGGTIGGGKNGTDEDATAGYFDMNHSGNVFGGSMGRITLLDGSTNPLWPKLAVVKLTEVNISGTADIKRNVYGGGEFGIVRNNATVNVTGGTIRGHLFGAGYGSIDHNTKTVIKTAGYDDLYYGFTPMIWAGCVSGDTEVKILGGTVEKNVYGGGEYASVGLINYKLKEDGAGEFIYKGKKYAFSQITKHTDLTKEFAMSWPYEFNYIKAAPDDDPAVGGKKVGGKATVTITGGHIGTATVDDVQGYVYGGGMGKPMNRYTEAFCANVRETEVNIHYPSTPVSGCDIFGSVYGGGENGHVYENTKVDITGGLIGMSVYAGGKGKDKYHVTVGDEELKNFRTEKYIDGDIYSITAGKVYGNTNLTMKGGHVMRNVYGGGFMASVGKGNYAGGADDYSAFDGKCGYGEAIEGNLWTSATVGDGYTAAQRDNAWHFLNSGKATIKITGGIIGTPDGTYGELPTGNVVGGSRGEAAPNVFNQPVHLYNPTFHVGNINEAEIIIGTKDQATDPATAGQSGKAPRIYASVYGGGQDGHMRRDSKVTIYSGEIGNTYTSTSGDQNDPQWQYRGNVFGSGSGIGKYRFDYQDGKGLVEGLSFLAGCVARFSEVDIQGGIIHRNVYGGGSVAGTGMPKFYGQNYEPYKKGDTADGHTQGKQSMNTVSISGGTIGQEGYGGNVFGASRGEAELVAMENPMFATSIWTEVNISGGTIYNNVYGGGELGSVKMDTKVNLTGGDILHDAYGGGKGIKTTDGTGEVKANIGGNVTVLLNDNNSGDVADGTKPGCSVSRIFGGNDQNGTPKGHIKVHVYATQHPNREKHSTMGSKYQKYLNIDNYTITNYSSLTDLASTVGVNVTEYTSTLASGTATSADKQNALNAMREAISLKKYDVQAVYGGGNLAPYVPTAALSSIEAEKASAFAEVIIDGCELTSIKQVYGNSNAASSPASHLTVYGCHEIDELFGGGNGKDDYRIGTTYYKNPGADVGYYIHYHYASQGSGTEAAPYEAILNTDASTKSYREANYGYGTGEVKTDVYGGRIHMAYGGSNEKGNIRTLAMSTYETASTCDLIIDHTYGAGKNALIDGETRMVIDCVDYMARIFGGSTNSNVNNDINLTITNGVFGQVFGGNDRGGKVEGSITVNIKESGCKPIIIDELYGGGYLAGYSIYGYNDDDSPRTKEQFEEAKTKALDTVEDQSDQTAVNNALIAAGVYGFPKADPRINIISATKIGDVYGGGYQAKVIGSPTINVNMEPGHISAKYAYDTASGGMKTEYSVGKHTLTTTYKEDAGGVTYVKATGTYVKGTTYYTDDTGETTVNTTGFEEGVTDVSSYYVVGSGSLVERERKDNYEVIGRVTEDGPDKNNAILKIGTIGNIFGGGNEADVIGNATVEIGTGSWLNYETHVTENIDRNAAFIIGNVYGGGKMGHVGNFTKNSDGKPTSCAEGTGITRVVVSNGEIGPDNMQMTASGGPDDRGHVFGGGQGTVDLLYDVNTTGMTDAEKLAMIKAMSKSDMDEKEALFNNMAFVDSTEVIINGTAFVKGSVYGGSENGHVLHNTGVKISGDCQIGNGDGVNRRYTSDEWAYDGSTNEKSLAECASWPYGQKTTYQEKEYTVYAPYDKFAAPGKEVYDDTLPAEDIYETENLTQGGRSVASDGHTFYGNVFGGGSGYYPCAPRRWVEKAGEVEGNTWVDITGGHILTSIYGGNELTDVLGDTHVSFGGTATLGVPRTLAQIAAHPVTCYLFGAGKGDQRIFFNKMTNVEDVYVNINGGKIFGSVFGGGEDGHVQGKVTMNIGKAATAAVGTEGEEGYKPAVPSSGPTIGTWGTSYVDGNVFGGGRGFSGDAYSAGNVAGSVTMNIRGGQMLGSVYGGGRLGSVGYGLYETGNENYGKMLDDNKDDVGKAVANFPRGHITINITGGTIGNNNEFRSVPTDVADLNAWKTANHVPQTTYESTSKTVDGTTTYTHRLLHTRGGNVFGGGMGRRTKLDGSVIDYVGIDWKKLGNVKSTKLTIDGDAWIMGNVYGGGELGAVTGNHTVSGGTTPAGTEIIIKGGTIGTEITDGAPQQATVETANTVRYTFGSVYGGGYGTDVEEASVTTNADVNKFGALVTGNTTVNMSGGLVRASVYGGGELAAVGGNTSVTVSGGEIGRNEVQPSDSENPGYVMFGGITMGNVYGGGMGNSKNSLLGVVKGNTQVNINPGTVTGEPFIYHNVYGGGALGSVGSFIFSDGVGDGKDLAYMATVPKGIPLIWTAGTGVATVNITGGTIGISGRDNGMVNGSSRGDIAKPEPTTLGSGTVDKDPYDKMAWVEETVVNIGTSGASTGPKIKGSVYGGGENGHVFTKAEVNVKSGQIGITEGEDWYDFGTTALNEAAWITRGNVYGAGCGTDMYDSNDDGTPDRHNSWAGCVIGNTVVNISGGLVTQNVYGGGSLGSVGKITNDPSQADQQHTDPANGFALSWPAVLEYDKLSSGSESGTTTVNITGGRIGTTGSDNGDVFGGARGEAGDSYEMMSIGNVKKTAVNINFTPNVDAVKAVMDEGKAKIRIDLKDSDGKLVNAIAGSVYGGSENGHVYENTSVTLTNGLVGHALYGGGKGKGTYTRKLKRITDGKEYDAEVYSLTSGKVFGNTSVTMADGLVMRNIYGGGNMGSVGKGNYAGGADDYSTSGYGETLTGNLWTSNFDPSKAEGEDNVKDNAWHFLNSGKTTVTVTGGKVGYIDSTHPEASYKDGLPYGNIFGGCRGESAPVVPDRDDTPRYLVCPQFFSGYVNETDVTIGASTTESGPTILGTVYGGGEDGHVRRNSHVKVYGGTIGLDFTEANKTLLGSSSPSDPQWLYRGNVYGAGSGISEYKFDFNADGDTNDEFTIGGRKYQETGYSTASGSVTHLSRVDAMGGTIYGNIYGGGSLASVGAPKITQTDYAAKIAATDYSNPSAWGTKSLNLVNIGGLKPTESSPYRTVTIGSPAGVQGGYGGNVFGASRGEISLGSSYGSSVWTQVNIQHGSTIMGNVFGGGDNGSVLKDSNVEVGAE